MTTTVEPWCQFDTSGEPDQGVLPYRGADQKLPTVGCHPFSFGCRIRKGHISCRSIQKVLDCWLQQLQNSNHTRSVTLSWEQ